MSIEAKANPRHSGRPTAREAPDLSEKGGLKDGAPQSLDRRLFFQLQVFGGCRDIDGVTEALKASGIEGALYADVNDPQGIGLLTFNEDPSHFVTKVRDLLGKDPFAGLEQKLEYAMFGRTYSIGYEPDLEEWLLNRPRRRALNPDWPWVIWYPLRRKGAFVSLSAEEQKAMLREHGGIGLSFGAAELAHDIRLACHGLDKNDNDFVIGLLGKELYPLSALTERMRATVQTAQYIESMGPFFVGKALWKSPL